MIGHYLLSLCPDAESAILTGKMKPDDYGTPTVRCLVGWAADHYHGHPASRPRFYESADLWTQTRQEYADVEIRYDRLCRRFGTDRTNGAIRNRILANQARRMLHNVPGLVRASL